MPLTEQQRSALSLVRARFQQSILPTTATVTPLEQRARLPDPAHLPADLTARVETAPPAPSPLLDVPLRAPEPVPVFFYALGPAPDPAHTPVLFFIHGGANVVGHPTEPQYLQLFASLLRAARTPCVLAAPSYRLATAPQNAFPAALQDIVAAYDHVLGQGYSADSVVLVGDSAGANHALVLTHLLLRAGRPAPRGVVAIAPFAIQAHALMSEYAKAQAPNDLINTGDMDELVRAYVGDSGLAPTDPLISGAFVPIDVSWPKTLILVGSADQVIDASRVLAKRLQDAQRPVELIEYDERPHAWWILYQIFPDDVQDAAQRIAQFVLTS